MAAASKSTPKTKPNDLIVYRLELVEQAVRDNTLALANKDNITKGDLVEFRERLFETIAVIQKELGEKADKSETAALSVAIKDLKGLVKAVGAIFSTIITALVVYYLTTGSK